MPLATIDIESEFLLIQLLITEMITSKDEALWHSGG